MILLRSLPQQEVRVAVSSLRFSGPWKLDVSHTQTIDLKQQTTLISQVLLGMYKTQRRSNIPKQRGMPVLIKGFPQHSENKEQGSPEQTVFNTLLQYMVATKQESLKDKVLELVYFINRSYNHSRKPCSVSEQVAGSVSKRGHRRPDRFWFQSSDFYCEKILLLLSCLNNLAVFS